MRSIVISAVRASSFEITIVPVANDLAKRKNWFFKFVKDTQVEYV